jgi:hypothetical protein
LSISPGDSGGAARAISWLEAPHQSITTTGSGPSFDHRQPG